VVRAEGSGFHARVWPAPAVPWGRLAVAAAGFGAAGGALAAWSGLPPGAALAAASSVVGFGVLVVGAPWLAGFVPVELVVDDDHVYWHGERYGWDRIRSARADGGALHLLDGAGGVVDTLPHLRPEVAGWLAAAIRASVPEPARPG
jgi:hypothetical protein